MVVAGPQFLNNFEILTALKGERFYIAFEFPASQFAQLTSAQICNWFGHFLGGRFSFGAKIKFAIENVSLFFAKSW